jgi:phosphate/sulfate permease
MGLTTGQANPRVMLNILLSWIVTLPCAALIGGAAYAALRHV